MVITAMSERVVVLPREAYAHLLDALRPEERFVKEASIQPEDGGYLAGLVMYVPDPEFPTHLVKQLLVTHER